MNFQKYSFLYIIVITIASIFLSFFLWDKIVLEYSNPNEIIGEYAANSHNVYNDSLRYLVFVAIPVLTFFGFFLCFKDNNLFYDLNLDLFKIDTSEKPQIFSIKNFFIIITILLIIFLLKDWDNFTFSIFEEGMPLSGGTNFELGQKPWKDIYLNTGLFHDLINAKIAWSIFGYKSIGAYKFLIQFLNLITKILILYLVYLLSVQINLKQVKNLFFIFSSMSILFALTDATLWKDLPTILFLICILNYLNYKKNFSLIGICFLSIISFFWSLDKGFFILFTFIPFLFFIFLNDKKDFIKFILSFSFFLIITIFALGFEIFLEFLKHSKEIFSQHEIINGIIHPTPFSDQPDATRASKSLVLIVTNFIITILLVFNKENFFSNNTKFFFIFFSMINFILYKSALSRSDGGHIQMASYFSIILFLIYLNFFTLNYLKKKNYLDKSNKYENLIFFVLITFFVFFNKINIDNSKQFIKRIKFYVQSNDKKFLGPKYYSSMKKLEFFFKDEDCIFLFSYDQAVPYLLQKKSCSKFSNVWVIGSKKNQLQYINQLEKNESQYILRGGSVSFQNLSERYPYIEDYISAKYLLYKEIDFWKIYKKK